MTAGKLSLLKEKDAFMNTMLLCPMFQHGSVECWNSSFEEQLLYRNVRVKMDVVINGY
jgi:hypothetical protein